MISAAASYIVAGIAGSETLRHQDRAALPLSVPKGPWGISRIEVRLWGQDWMPKGVKIFKAEAPMICEPGRLPRPPFPLQLFDHCGDLASGRDRSPDQI